MLREYYRIPYNMILSNSHVERLCRATAPVPKGLQAVPSSYLLKDFFREMYKINESVYIYIYVCICMYMYCSSCPRR